MEDAQKVQTTEEFPEYGPGPANITPDVDSWKYDPSYMKLMDYFQISSDEGYLFKDKLETIGSYLTEKTGNKDVLNHLFFIKKLQRELGESLDERRINQVYRWIKLDQDELRIKNEKALYEKKVFDQRKLLKPRVKIVEKIVPKIRTVTKVVEKIIYRKKREV